MIHVVAGLFEGEIDHRYLIGRRRSGAFDRCWEFPGGKVDEGESPSQALRREWDEELECDIRVYEWVAGYHGVAPAGKFSLDLHRVHLRPGSTMPKLTKDHYELVCASLAQIEALPPEECTPSLQPLVRSMRIKFYV